MDVNVFLADSVVVAEDKLYAQGAGWDSIVTNKLPCTHARLGIGALFSVAWDEANHTHEFAVDVVDPDGVLLPLHPEREPDDESGDALGLLGQLNVGRSPWLNEGETQVVPVAINVDHFALTKLGAYAVVVSANGRELRRVPFYVRSGAAPSAGPGPRFV